MFFYIYDCFFKSLFFVSFPHCLLFMMIMFTMIMCDLEINVASHCFSSADSKHKILKHLILLYIMSIISYFYCYFVDRNFYCIYSHKRFCSHLFHKINISHLVLFKFKLDFIQINVFIDFYFNDLMFLIFHLLKYISNWLQCFNYFFFLINYFSLFYSHRHFYLVLYNWIFLLHIFLTCHMHVTCFTCYHLICWCMSWLESVLAFDFTVNISSNVLIYSVPGKL